MIKYFFITFICVFFVLEGSSQEVFFFTEGTNSDFYDQGIVDVNNLGASEFEHTYPPGGSPTKWNDKIPCSATAFKGNTALKFNYTSAENGNWSVRVHRNDWSAVDISGLDSISFFIYSENEFPKTALPLIALMTEDGTSEFDTLVNYNANISASQWTQIKYPVAALNGTFDLTQSKAIILAQSENDNSSRLILIDNILAFKSISTIPKVEEFSVEAFDSHAELNWNHPMEDLSYRIYASFDGGVTYILRTETTEDYFLDFVPDSARNSEVNYRIVATTQGKESEVNELKVQLRDFSDEELMDMVQRYSFRYFWEGAHQASGMALERSNGSGKTAASGATGMGLMAMIVAHEREYHPRDEVKDRIIKILHFLDNCERHHGAWSHWYDAETYKTQPFSPDDDGGDIVETSFVAQALVALKNYFSGSDSKSTQIQEKADKLWKEIEWDWYTNGGQNQLFWHWSPNTDFQKNMKVRGWNECLGTYIMAAASPSYSVSKEVYTNGWAKNGNMVDAGREYYGYEINLARDWGGPLFWIHYSHHGINPHGLSDEYADYWQEHVNTAKIHYEYAKDNPLNFENYSENCWGLTASDDPDGYTAHKPMSNDNGTVSPTAALASIPYTPEESMQALKYFYRERGSELFGEFGTYDAFNDSRDWVKESYIGIDQGPIVIMIENYRTGLLWENVMKDADVQAGLDKLGFQYEVITDVETVQLSGGLIAFPNPAKDEVVFSLPDAIQNNKIKLSAYSILGQLVLEKELYLAGKQLRFNCSTFQNGIYIFQISTEQQQYHSKILIQN